MNSLPIASYWIAGVVNFPVFVIMGSWSAYAGAPLNGGECPCRLPSGRFRLSAGYIEEARRFFLKGSFLGAFRFSDFLQDIGVVLEKFD